MTRRSGAVSRHDWPPDTPFLPARRRRVKWSHAVVGRLGGCRGYPIRLGMFPGWPQMAVSGFSSTDAVARCRYVQC